ncbi:hypothetical protein AS29_006105 [Bacillus sp. SJS]|nr:hypothetical protein AS29_006105 [Bacillus sp. SJS]
MSDLYGAADRNESIATIHEALEKGITVLDTGDFYETGHNELLLRVALQGKKLENAFIAVKTGVLMIGARKRSQLQDAFGALNLKLTEADLARIEEAVPAESVIGTRYAAEQMGMLGVE